MAGDEGGLVGAQPDDGVGDLGRGPEPPDGFDVEELALERQSLTGGATAAPIARTVMESLLRRGGNP